MDDAASQKVSQRDTGVGAADSAVANPAAAAAQAAVAGADTTAAAKAAASAATDVKRSPNVTPAAAAAKAAVASTIAAGAAANGALILGRVPREAAGPLSGQVGTRVPPLPRPDRGSGRCERR